MRHARLARAAGACALVAGAAWSVAVVVHASQPVGCVGDECLLRPEREPAPAMDWLVPLAGVGLVAFAAVLVALLARRGELGWTGKAGLLACGAGVVALALLRLAPADERFRPLPALAVVALGLALLAWAVVRSTVLPRWSGIALVVGVAFLVGVNEEDTRVLFALPFGVALLAAGAALALRPPEGRTA